MGRRMLTLALAAACAGCLVVPEAASAGTLDQQQPDGAPPGFDVDSTQSMAQTFTAGLSGGLDQVDLKLSETATAVTLPLMVEIRNAAGGQPGDTVLAGESIPASAAPPFMSPAFVPVSFASPAPVTAGTQYAIVAYNADLAPTRFWGWADAAANPYAPGSAFFQGASPPGPTWTNTIAGTDLAFKTYVVTPTPAAAVTGKRAAALKKCKKKRSKAKRRKCRKKAQKLPA
jgi:hypothetical protein